MDIFLFFLQQLKSWAGGEGGKNKKNKYIKARLALCTLWARILRPSAARVTSVKLSLENSRPKTLSRLLEWLFHFRQNWWWDISMMVHLKPIAISPQSHIITSSIMRYTEDRMCCPCYFRRCYGRDGGWEREGFLYVFCYHSLYIPFFFFKFSSLSQSVCLVSVVYFPPTTRWRPSYREKKTTQGRLEIDRAETCYFSFSDSAS